MTVIQTSENDVMAQRSIEEQLAQLDAKRKTLQARLLKQERAKDTRRKILIGSFVLDRLEKNRDEEFLQHLSEWLRRELPEFLPREEDKELFADQFTESNHIKNTETIKENKENILNNLIG